MIGAIIGDIVGSRFEFTNNKTKNFELFDIGCRPTDDSLMTIAVAASLMESANDPSLLTELATYYMQEIGTIYPDAGFGKKFREWLRSENPTPYGSYANGAAMRISPVGFINDDLDIALKTSDIITNLTHNHEDSIKAARAVTSIIVMSRSGASKEQIREHIINNYYPHLPSSIDEIRPTYKFDVSCKGSVPQAITAFLEGIDFEDTIRNAISLGGDSDTIAAIAGGMAEAFFGVPRELAIEATNYLDKDLLDIVDKYYDHGYGLISY